MRYEDLTLDLMRSLRPMWNRVIAFDLETDTRESRLLADERILAISIAYREQRDTRKKETNKHAGQTRTNTDKQLIL